MGFRRDEVPMIAYATTEPITPEVHGLSIEDVGVPLCPDQD